MATGTYSGAFRDDEVENGAQMKTEETNLRPKPKEKRVGSRMLELIFPSEVRKRSGLKADGSGKMLSSCSIDLL